MSILNFLFEAGQLKRVKRSGWWTVGIKDPESVAEHSFRTAVLGYILAKQENVDENIVLKMCLFQDFSEARINDLHKIGQKYIDFKPAEKKAFNDQLELLPDNMKTELKNLFENFQTDKKEGIVARDADLLECALQAKEYKDTGYKTQNWIDNVEKLLKTESAKKLLTELKDSDPYAWWEGLKKIER